MIATATFGVAGLFVSLVVGVLIHELLHVLVLKTAGVRCSLVLRPAGTDSGGFQTLVSGSWASVEMESIPATCSLWRLRAAAMAPLAMLLPVGGYAWFVASGPAGESLVASLVVIGWMACALPSPADFSIVWHPAEARALVAEGE
jgi:hypothetical protein